MSNDWTIEKNGKRIGPVADVTIQDLLRVGQLQPTDRIWKPGMSAWTTIKEVSALNVGIPPPITAANSPIPARATDGKLPQKPSPQETPPPDSGHFPPGSDGQPEFVLLYPPLPWYRMAWVIVVLEGMTLFCLGPIAAIVGLGLVLSGPIYYGTDLFNSSGNPAVWSKTGKMLACGVLSAVSLLWLLYVISSMSTWR